ncbi:RNA-binding S4 domain-containing protein [bacterium]|nr:RNA-binding S4 domain-containing protein [bacterium]
MEVPCVDEPYLKLDQFLKWAGAVESGGQAKMVILAGQVLVNGEVENRRGRKLRKGDSVAFNQQSWVVDPEVR